MKDRGWNTPVMAGHRLRSVALLSTAALALHDFRYLAGYAAEAEAALAEQGHGYLAAIGPLAGLLLGFAALELVFQIVRPRRVPGPGTPPRFALRWASAAAALVVVYATQELVEGALFSGHPDGIAGVLASGGWTALPLAAALGVVVAGFLRGAELLVQSCARPTRSRPRRALTAPRVPRPLPLPRCTPLAAHLAGRAPPQALAS